MMTKQERALELRADATRHYNCCQAVLLPFAEELGLDGETALALAEHFGAGMRRGSVCGAVTGGLMALGLTGKITGEEAQEFQRTFEEQCGALDCGRLLEAAEERGEEKKVHCDRVVCLAAELVEKMRQSGGEK